MRLQVMTIPQSKTRSQLGWELCQTALVHCSPPRTSQRLPWRVAHRVWRGLQLEWVLILTQHALMSMYPWHCGSCASPRLGYGMDWLSAGAVGSEDEAHTEEKYSVLKHTVVRSPIVSIVTIKVRGSIKFCMHFLH